MSEVKNRSTEAIGRGRRSIKKSGANGASADPIGDRLLRSRVWQAVCTVALGEQRSQNDATGTNCLRKGRKCGKASAIQFPLSSQKLITCRRVPALTLDF